MLRDMCAARELNTVAGPSDLSLSLKSATESALRMSVSDCADSLLAIGMYLERSHGEIPRSFFMSP